VDLEGFSVKVNKMVDYVNIVCIEKVSKTKQVSKIAGALGKT
jgi:predicted amino acid racemase